MAVLGQWLSLLTVPVLWQRIREICWVAPPVPVGGWSCSQCCFRQHRPHSKDWKPFCGEAVQPLVPCLAQMMSLNFFSKMSPVPILYFSQWGPVVCCSWDFCPSEFLVKNDHLHFLERKHFFVLDFGISKLILFHILKNCVLPNSDVLAQKKSYFYKVSISGD